MKAVIFNSSVKDPKYSNTYAWCKVLANRLEKRNIQSEIVNLKEIDYEASTSDKDTLYKQFEKVYDASLIIFATPIFLGQVTFSMRNLLDRFKVAYERAQKANERSLRLNSAIKVENIFKNKLFETYIGFDVLRKKLQTKFPKKRNYFDNNVPVESQTGDEGRFGMKKREQVLRKEIISCCDEFMTPVGFDRLHLGTKSPKNPHGLKFDDDRILLSNTAPDYKTMHQDKETITLCDEFIDEFLKAREFHVGRNKTRPKRMLKETFAEFFKADDKHSFGKGWTLGVNDLNEESVKKHRIAVRKSGEDLRFIMQAWVCMKERCMSAGNYPLADEYYGEQFRVIANGFDGDTFSGNFRPNNY